MYSKVEALTERLVGQDRSAVLFYKFVLSVCFAVLTGLSAQFRLMLPVTPVPVTAQTMVVLLSGVFLGPVFGALSQMMYLAWGMVGMPWFSGAMGGFLSVFMPSFGYIIGFIPAAAITGFMAKKPAMFANYFTSFISLVIGVLPIYFFGLIHLTVLSGGNVMTAFMLGVLPFILVGLTKMALLAFFMPSLVTKR